MKEIRPLPARNLAILVVGAIAMLLTLVHSAVGSTGPNTLSGSSTRLPKSAQALSAPESPGRVTGAGDNVATAPVILALPFTDNGSTCGFNDDYTPTCTPGGTPAPDVVYKFTPTSNTCVNISLCNSGYDTGLYVWQTAIGNVVACNDDACGFPSRQQSRISNLQLLANTTYYIVVDGFTGCGSYELRVTPCPPSCAPLACPPGAIQENEPVCGTGYVDQTNGGCNSTPPMYQAIPVPSTICGQFGKYCDQPGCTEPLRDTDWYQVQLAQASVLRLCVRASFRLRSTSSTPVRDATPSRSSPTR